MRQSRLCAGFRAPGLPPPVTAAAGTSSRPLFLQTHPTLLLATLCSIYGYEQYPFLWDPITCMLSNVSYSNRVNVLGGWRRRAARGGRGWGWGQSVLRHMPLLMPEACASDGKPAPLTPHRMRASVVKRLRGLIPAAPACPALAAAVGAHPDAGVRDGDPLSSHPHTTYAPARLPACLPRLPRLPRLGPCAAKDVRLHATQRSLPNCVLLLPPQHPHPPMHAWHTTVPQSSCLGWALRTRGSPGPTAPCLPP